MKLLCQKVLPFPCGAFGENEAPHPVRQARAMSESGTDGGGVGHRHLHLQIGKGQTWRHKA